MNFFTYIRKTLHNFKTSVWLFAVVSGLLLSACIDENGLENCYTNQDETLEIQFAIPDLRSILTRATVEEIMIKDLVALVFADDSEGKLLASNNYQTDDIRDNTITLSLSGNVRDYSMVIYLVANPEKVEDIKNISNIEALRKYSLENPIDLSAGLPMIGYQSVEADATSASMSLTRSVAKISVAVTDKAKDVPIQGIQMSNNADKGWLSSPINTEAAYKDEYVFQPNNDGPDTFNDKTVTYSYPSKGYQGGGSKDKGAFAVVKVTRNNMDQYYRINFRTEQTKGNQKELIHLDLLANHLYQIEITEFKNDGYSTPEAAANAPESDNYLEYVIHDHAEEVFSMTSDGMRELGVTAHVTLSTDEEHKTAIVVVKCYDASDPEATIKIGDIKIIDESAWLLVEEKGVHDSDGDFHKEWDLDNPGKQFEFIVSLKPEESVYEDQTGYFTVSWQGLERRVQVNYEAAFLLPTVCDVELTMKGDGESHVIKDYWTFVTGAGKAYTADGDSKGESNTPQLFGIRPKDMSGKKRTGGFHFPMPMGKTDQWTYEYKIDFAPLAENENTGKTIDQIDMEWKGDSYWSDKLNWQDNKNGTGKLTFTGTNDYTYAGGTITFKVHFKDEDATSEILASLYHTGIFHYLGETIYVDEEDRGYYYYEVVPMGGNDARDFWLDRNIGAKANTPFIDIEQYFETDDKESRNAAGKLYTIINQTQSFKLPVFDDGMVPPGYHIPNQSEWDEVRLHKNFLTRDTIIDHTTYMATYYNTGNPKIGEVHFQKARYYNKPNVYHETAKFSDTPNVGDAGAAYYWTVTEAPAMEKEEMGNWLRALYLNGSASSYINASVTDHRMPIRCKAGLASQADTQKEYFVSFNVHEVTHIFLFDMSNPNDPTPLYTFPGKAVGTTASAVQWQYFYSSTTVNPANIGMIFVKLQEDGKIIIYRRDGTSFTSSASYNPSYITNASNYWKAEEVQGKFLDFCDLGKGRDNNVSNKQPAGCVTEEDFDIGNEDFELEYPERETLILKKTIPLSSWDDNTESSTQNKIDWKTLKVPATIKVYTRATGSGYNVQAADGKWNKFAEVTAGNRENTGNATHNMWHPSSKDQDVRVVTITITNEFMQKLRNNNGMIFWGIDYIFLGYSYIDGTEDFVEPPKIEFTPEFSDPEKETVYWKGDAFECPSWQQLQVYNNNMNLNWNDHKEGDELRIYIKRNNFDVLQIFTIEGSWQDFDGKDHRNVTTINNNEFDVIKIPLTQSLLNQLKRSTGLAFQGAGFTLYGITVVRN